MRTAVGRPCPECLDDWIDEDNPVRVADAFVDALDVAELEFDGVVPEATDRPAYHPAVLLKLYIYSYLNRMQSSRRLEREAARNGATHVLMKSPPSVTSEMAQPVLAHNLTRVMNFTGAQPLLAAIRA